MSIYGPLIKVKKTGRVKLPMLDDPQMKAIGDVIVKEQKQRWDDGITADGIPGRKLSRRYFFIKRKFTKQVNPIRDMKMTGDTVANFSLRRASRGVIRAENTTRETRKRATTAQKYADMIGFAASDQIALFRACQAQYGEYVKKAWVPLGYLHRPHGRDGYGAARHPGGRCPPGGRPGGH